MPRAAVAVTLAVLLVAGACSDDEPPDWLVERATPSTTSTTTTTPTTVPPDGTGGTEGREVLAVDLEPGACIDDASAFTGQDVGVISRTTVVPCRVPHQAEVYARARLDAEGDTSFPGINRLRRQAQRLCRERFRPFVGIPWTRSELEIAALWPSPRSWRQGDRLVVCAVFRLDGAPLTGSARGSAI